MCKVHIAVQELRVVPFMLYEMAFHLSGEVVALHLHCSTAKAHLCIQGGTCFLFPD